MTRRSSWAAASHAAVLLAALGGLAGCAGLDPATRTGEAAGTPAAAGAAERPQSPLAAFQDRQRAAAEAAEQQGHWSRAAWAWESLLAVRPTDAAVAARLQQARRAADSRATLLGQQARLALQLGDIDGARDLFLRALVAEPTHQESIDGLRALEDERVRRQFVPPDAARQAPPRSIDARAAAEFASLLVVQGELERAIDWLTPLASARRADPALRRQLSDILLMQAEREHPGDASQALATVRRSLQMDPRNTRASTRLREWQRTRSSGP
jgi:tetratricopeptide (TPR) repeat protein